MTSDLSSSDSGNWMRPPSLQITPDVGSPRYWYIEFNGLTVIQDVASFFVDVEGSDTDVGKSGLLSTGSNLNGESSYISAQYNIWDTGTVTAWKWWGVFQDSGAGAKFIPQFLPYTAVNCTIKAGTNIKAWQID